MKGVPALRASTERTLESLYRRHAKDVYRYALAVLDSPADAEDVTQTTFINAYRAIKRGERPRRARNWLRTIARNLCREQFRERSRRPRTVTLDEDVGDLVADDDAPTLDEVLRALQQLPHNQRAALVMRELEGRPLKGIASDLGVSPSAVETLLFRARRGLREQIEGGLLCAEAERAVSRQLDGTLSRIDRGALRAHLRECESCATLARRLRAQRGALKSLALVPLPSALASAPQVGAGATAAGAGMPVFGTLASKFAVAGVAAALIGGVGYVTVVHHAGRSASRRLVVSRPTGLASSAAQRASSGVLGLSLGATPGRPVKLQPGGPVHHSRHARVVGSRRAEGGAVAAPAGALAQPAGERAKPGAAKLRELGSPSAQPTKPHKTSQARPKPPKQPEQSNKPGQTKQPKQPRQAKPKPAPSTTPVPSKTKPSDAKETQ